MSEKFNLCYENINCTDLNKQFLRFTIKEILIKVPKLCQEKDDVKLKICLVRYGARGDVLLMTPVLRKIREKYKNIDITVSTDYPDMIQNNPNIDHIIPIKQDYSKFDRTYFLAYEFNPNVHISKAYADQVGIEIDDYKPDLYLTESEMQIANKMLDNMNCKNFFVLHSECDWLSRRWHGWNQLIEKLQNDPMFKTYSIIEVGKGEQKFTPYNIPIIRNSNIRIIAALIQYSTGIICIDSGIMHIGVALNKPVFSIFGITDPNKRLPEKWIPLATQHDGHTSGIHHNRSIPVENEPENIQDCINDMKNLDSELIYTKMQVFYGNNNVNFSIIIPSCNKFEYTYECIMSIFRDTKWNRFEIIIADDYSKEETKNRLRIFDKLCRVQYYEEKVGFTKNCNRAAVMAKGDIIILLNNDTRLLTKDWLRYVWEDLENKETGIVGVKLLYPNMTIQHSGCIYDGKHFRHIYKHLPRNYIRACEIRNYNCVTGAFIAIRKKDWKDMKGFDERFNQSAEDTDLCLRMNYEIKKKILYDNRIEFIHYEGITYGLEKEFDQRNVQLLKDKWSGKLSNEVPFYYEKESNVPIFPPYRLEFGSGFDPNKGYIHVDIQSCDERGQLPHLEINWDVSKQIPIGDNKVSEILANHVIEHLGWVNLVPVLTDWYRLLCGNGKLFIRTPNLEFIMNGYKSGQITREHPDDETNIRKFYGDITPSMWANLKLFSGQNYKDNFHNLCLDKGTLVNIAKRIGFKYFQPFEGREYSPGEIRMVLIK
jgi:ADP-heptose:LPS heptosyltransferase/GT2 family glycosyltransferase/predicted SAM-dependent methyltransferase